MATKWDDLISDKNAYPDDTVLKLADGTEVTLGSARPGYMKDADYRQKTASLARQRDEFESTAVARMQAIQEGEAQLMQIAREIAKANPGMTRQEVRQEVNEDETVQRLRAEIAEIRNAVVPMANAMQEFDNRSKAERQRAVVNEHRRALADIKATDPSLNEAELIQFAKDNFTPNLKHAYKLMKYEEHMASEKAKTREEALKEGYEKARSEIVAPTIPLRRTVEPRPADAPKNMRDAVAAALKDPDVMNPLMGHRV